MSITERIEIQLVDKIEGSIEKKIEKISRAAFDAGNTLKDLQDSLSRVFSGKSGSSAALSEIESLTAGQRRYIQSLRDVISYKEKLAVLNIKVATAQEKLVAAQARTTTVNEKLDSELRIQQAKERNVDTLHRKQLSLMDARFSRELEQIKLIQDRRNALLRAENDQSILATKKQVTADLKNDQLRVNIDLLRERSRLLSLQSEAASNNLQTSQNRTNINYASALEAENRVIEARQRHASVLAELRERINNVNDPIARQAALQQLNIAQTNTSIEFERLRNEQAQRRADITQRQTVNDQALIARAGQYNQAQLRLLQTGLRLEILDERLRTVTINRRIAEERFNQLQQRSTDTASQLALQEARVSTERSRTTRETLSAIATEERLNRTREQSQREGSSPFGFSNAYLIGLAQAQTSNILSLADEYISVQNRLAQVSTSQENFNFLLTKLRSASLESGISLKDTVDTFVGYDQALQKTGASQEYVLRLTTTLQKALKLYGATSAETSSVLLQLKQALSSQTLGGEELRALSENAPILVNKIFEKFGNNIRIFREKSKKGLVDLKTDVTDAILSMEKEIDKLNSQRKIPFEDSLQSFKTLMTETFGQLAIATDAANKFAESMQFLANNTKLVTFSTIILSLSVMAVILKELAPLVFIAGRDLQLLFTTTPLGRSVAGLILLTTTLYTFKDAIIDVGDEHYRVGNIVSEVYSSITNEIKQFASEAIAAFDTVLNFINGNPILSRILGVGAGAVAGAVLGGGVPGAAIGAVASALGIGVLSGSTPLEKDNSLSKLFSKTDFAKRLSERQRLENELDFGVRGGFEDDTYTRSGKNRVTKFDPEAARAADRRARSLENEATKQANLTNEIKSQINAEKQRFGLTDTQLKVQTKLNEIAEKYLRTKKSHSTDKDAQEARNYAESFRQLVTEHEKAVRIDEAQRKIINDLKEPLTSYNIQLEAIRKLYKDPSNESYIRFAAKAKEVYAGQTDSLKSYNDELRKTDFIRKNSNLSLQDSIALYEYSIKLLNNPALKREDEATVLKKIREARVQNQVLDYRADSPANKLDQLDTKKQALSKAKELGYVSELQYLREISKLENERNSIILSDKPLSFVESVQEALRRAKTEYKDLNAEVVESFTKFRTTLDEGLASSITGALFRGESFFESLANIGKNALEQLLQQLIKVQIQALVTGDALSGIGGGGGGGGLDFGGLFISALSLIAGGASTSSQTSAYTGGIKGGELKTRFDTGFATGGYTGDYPTNYEVGIVHGQEYVTNAASTARYMPILEAINNGTYNPNANSAQGVGNVNIVVENHGAPVTARKERLSNGDIKLILDAVGSATRDPNSSVSKGFQGSFNVSRKV